MEHLLIGILYVAEVAAETVLIQFLLRVAVPEAAVVRRNLIGKNDLPVSISAELQLEVNEIYLL